MNSPKVSVIVPTYRRDALLIKALDSIAAQTYRNIEIIVVDDNADAEYSSEVRRAVNGFSERNPDVPLRLICSDANLGSARARNAGISEAEGEYVCFLDDDDIYLPDRIRTQLDSMMKNDADFGITDLRLYDENGKLAGKRVHSYITDKSTGEFMRCHLMYHLTGTDTLMFRRSYLIGIGCFDPIDVGDEFYLMHKAILAGGKLDYLPECHVKAFVHKGENGGLSSGRGKIDGENALYEFKRKFFPQLGKKTVRYIKMRHFAVLSYAYLRMKKPGKFFACGLKAFFAYPSGCVRMILGK